MKKFLSAMAIISVSTTMISATYAESNSTYTSDTAYWEAKKIDSQNKSTQMRKEYYEKYKSKGYDLSLLTPEIMDGTKTDENKFWEVLKKLQNQNEMQGRKDYVAKLSSKGIDVSGFTETVMNDSGKFWELANRLYAEYEQATKNATEYKKELEYKKQEEYKKELEYKRQEEYKKAEMKKQAEVKKQEEKKTETKPVNASVERAKKLFIQNLDKIPADKQALMYPRIEKNILKQIEMAKKRGANLLIQKLEGILIVLQSRMNDNESDESIMNSLFSE